MDTVPYDTLGAIDDALKRVHPHLNTNLITNAERYTIARFTEVHAFTPPELRLVQLLIKWHNDQASPEGRTVAVPAADESYDNEAIGVG